MKIKVKVTDKTPNKETIKLTCGENYHVYMDIPF